MLANTVTVRRIPCLCDARYKQLNIRPLPWKELPKEDMFKRVKGCYFEDMLGELNDWTFVRLNEKKGEHQPEELSLWHQDALAEKLAKIEQEITQLKVGAVAVGEPNGNAPDGFKLVMFCVAPPHTLYKRTQPWKS